ncbi:MAG: hypothetical protein BECKG1743D_GA0114223_104253 [Candidatus Kentron sp. G]|nr:MAG: hypothetical protein BECKG1743F_GA0114225_104423 [Candidatus Kentron sp. G]VFN03047.1 MAG: hypothetical protein BECKG1743D_GA0114223_104253 [Candidatus Kentron sp. G]
MSDPKAYIAKRRAEDPVFEEGFEDSYQSFKIDALKDVREASDHNTEGNVRKVPYPKADAFPHRESR